MMRLVTQIVLAEMFVAVVVVASAAYFCVVSSLTKRLIRSWLKRRKEALGVTDETPGWYCEGEAVGAYEAGICSAENRVHGAPCGPMTVTDETDGGS